MIYLTGDTHRGQSGDMIKLNSKKWPEGKKLTKEDYLIILGDFGFVWAQEGSDDQKTDLHVQKWLKEKPWTTIVIDGNHENHDMLERLPTTQKFGNEVRVINESIYLLKRGEVYEINGKSFFCMGGAESIDKENRTLGASWWPQEIPSYAEMDRGIESLEKVNWEVDYVLTHTCPEWIGQMYVSQSSKISSKINCAVGNYLDHLYQDRNLKFKKWYFGHWHDDWDYDNFRMLYQRVLPLD